MFDALGSVLLVVALVVGLPLGWWLGGKLNR